MNHQFEFSRLPLARRRVHTNDLPSPLHSHPQFNGLVRQCLKSQADLDDSGQLFHVIQLKEYQAWTRTRRDTTRPRCCVDQEQGKGRAQSVELCKERCEGCFARWMATLCSAYFPKYDACSACPLGKICPQMSHGQRSDPFMRFPVAGRQMRGSVSDLSARGSAYVSSKRSTVPHTAPWGVSFLAWVMATSRLQVAVCTS